MRLVAAVIAAAVATACLESVTGPTAPLDTSVTLKAGQRLTLQGTNIHVLFVRVDGDSRCPADAACVQGGDATVWLLVEQDGYRSNAELHTGTMAPVEAGGVTITLEALQPYPFSSRAIDPREYRATLRVSR